MRENRTSGSMRRGERRVMVHSANGHRTRKGGNGGAPPDLYTTALALHSTPGLSGRITVSLSRAGTSRWGVGFTGADYPQLGPRITLDVTHNADDYRKWSSATGTNGPGSSPPASGSSRSRESNGPRS